MHTRLITLLVLTAFTTTSDARPGAACAKVCRKISSCRLLTYDFCMDMCDRQGSDATPEARASTLAQANMSCAALANQMGPGEWLCTAEASISAGYAYGEKDTRGIHLLGNGKTRAAAVYKAISSCNSVLTMDLAIQRSTSDSDTLGAWEVETASPCRITQCIPPASARNQRQR
jgi:hypothetical protein